MPDYTKQQAIRDYKRLAPTAKTALKSKMGVANQKDFANHFGYKSADKRGELLRHAGFDSTARNKIVSAGSSKTEPNSYSAMGEHGQAEAIKQSTHDDSLRDKIFKQIRQDQDIYAAHKFMDKVAKEKELFRQKMRKESLKSRLEDEKKAGGYVYGNRDQSGQASHGVTSGGSGGRQPGQSGQPGKPPVTNNQFFSA